MYEDINFAMNVDEEPIWDESPPKIAIIICIFSLVLLAVSLFIPWISLAPIEIRKANMTVFQDWIQTLQANNPNIKGYVDQIGMSSDINLRLEPIIDKQGFEKIRRLLETIPAINGIQLLKNPETTIWIKILVLLEMSLVFLTLLWLISNFIRIEPNIKRILAGLILVVSSASLLFSIGLQPIIDTLGSRNKFGLVLLMTIFEAKPGIGFWICVIANSSLGTTFLFYLAANEVFTSNGREVEPNEWY